MPEREPDFEDDKVRVWRFDPPGERPEDDPTVLRINSEHEVPYESRVYGVRRGTENLAALMVIMARHAPGALPLPIAAILSEHFIREGLVKLLSKRQESSGDISLLVIGSALGRRFLLRPLRTFTATGYEAKVARFEAEWVDQGVLVRGPVVGPTEWDAYRTPEPPRL